MRRSLGAAALLLLAGCLGWRTLGAEPRALAAGHACKHIYLRAEPKSGTTWLEFIGDVVAEEYAAARGTHNLVDKRRREVTRVDGSKVLLDLHGNKHDLKEFGVPRGGAFAKSGPPRIDKAGVQERAKAMAKEGKCWVWMLRDPRDIAVSECFHRQGSRCRPDEYVRKKVGLISQWVAARKLVYDAIFAAVPKHVHLVLFDELKEDTAGGVQSLAEFADLPLTAAEAARVVAATTVDAMQELEEKHEVPGPAKVRKGNVCGFRKEISPKTAEFATQRVTATLPAELMEAWACAEP